MKVYICENYKNANWAKKVPSGEKLSLAFAKLCVCDYIGRRPERVEIKFEKNRYGKPFIQELRRKKGGRINRDAFFSLSHSGDILICAVSHCNIGADCQVVNIRDIKTCRKIAGRFFSPRENLVLDQLPDDDYTDKFFELWTKKEAYVKYTGRGLSEGLDTFSVFDVENVRFDRVTPCFEGAYIYICRSAENGEEPRVEYVKYIK